MFDLNGNVICTPKAIRQKVKRVFDLYASIPEFNVTFSYRGADPKTYSHCMGLPYDGSVNVELDCFTGKANGAPYGLWGPPFTDQNPTATSHLTYPGGEALFGPGYIDYMDLIHEIGHALGQAHIPALGANMSYYGGAFAGENNVGEYLQFTEQERADVIARNPTASAAVYRLSGSVQSDLMANVCSDVDVGKLGGVIDVYAVNTVNGRTYVGLANCNGDFSINILAAGSYRLVATPNGWPTAIDQSQYSASWYIDNSTATNDPVGGTVFTLNSSTPSFSGLVIKLGNAGAAPASFGLNPYRAFPDPSTFTAPGSATPVTFAPMMMSPGDSGPFLFSTRCDAYQSAHFAGTAHCDPVTSVTAYGTAPDYSYSGLTLVDSLGGTAAFTLNTYQVTVTANPGAAPGFRLMIASSTSGTKQVAIMGVHILNGPKKPSMFTTSLADQIAGQFNFLTLDADYWH